MVRCSPACHPPCHRCDKWLYEVTEARGPRGTASCSHSISCTPGSEPAGRILQSPAGARRKSWVFASPRRQKTRVGRSGTPASSAGSPASSLSAQAVGLETPPYERDRPVHGRAFSFPRGRPPRRRDGRLRLRARDPTATLPAPMRLSASASPRSIPPSATSTATSERIVDAIERARGARRGPAGVPRDGASRATRPRTCCCSPSFIEACSSAPARSSRTPAA